MAVRFGGEQEHRVACGLVRHDAMPVGVHDIALFRMQKETLPASATLCAAVAGDVCLLVHS
jgi:hypothetical protein